MSAVQSTPYAEVLAGRRIEAVVIGASAGGIDALLRLLPRLPQPLPFPVVALLHLPDDRDSRLAEVFRQRLGIPVRQADDKAVLEAGGAYFVSAFTGLGAPHWDMYARGAMLGLTRATTKAHFARAVLEGIAYQVRDLAETMEKDAGVSLAELKVDGGASVSNIMMQIQADLLGTRVNRPKCVESTALGAACLAGLATGVFGSTQDIAAQWESERTFESQIDQLEREKRLVGWRKALSRAMDWEARE